MLYFSFLEMEKKNIQWAFTEFSYVNHKAEVPNLNMLIVGMLLFWIAAESGNLVRADAFQTCTPLRSLTVAPKLI